jgi:hypothetical protein
MPPKTRPRLSRLCRVPVARTHETHDTVETQSPSEQQNEDAYIPTFVQPHDESLLPTNVDLSSDPHLSELLGTSIPPTRQKRVCTRRHPHPLLMDMDSPPLSQLSCSSRNSYPRAGLHNWYVSGVIFYFHF